MKNISKEEVLNIQVGFPTHSEQRAIARFLDAKTAQVDQLITQKRQMLELLREERAALISHAVTKGLDAGAPTRDSGVAWLGEVPAHWEVKRLKYFTNYVQTGSTPPSGSDEYFGEDVDWFGPSDFRDEIVLANARRRVSSLAVSDEIVKIYAPLTVLMIGIGATVGKVGIVATECASNQQVNAINFLERINPYFGAYYLRSISSIIVGMTNAATLPILNQSQTKDIWCSAPPRNEQDEIVQYIETHSARTTATAATINQEIALLQEYRAALIAEAVTGQIDVRHYEPAAALVLM